MPKYYVESGQIKTVIVGETPLDACVKAVRSQMKPDMETVDLKSIFIVSEQGFYSEKHNLDPDRYTDNVIIPIQNVMGVI
jgi:hypothetical protein